MVQNTSRASVDKAGWIYSIIETAYENEQQNIDLPDTICHNRFGHTGPDYSYNIDLCAAGETGLV